MATTFNGSSDVLTVTSAPVTTYPFTMACRFRPSVTSNAALMQISPASSADRFILAINATNIRAFAQTGASSGQADTSTTISANVWQHACAVFHSATSMTAYLNGGGKVTSTVSLGSFTTPTRLTIGARLLSGTMGLYFNGAIAEPGVWSAALTDDEVSSLSQGFMPPNVRPSALVFYSNLVRSVFDYARSANITVTGTGTTDHPRTF